MCRYTFANGNGVILRPAVALEPNALYTVTALYTNSLGEPSSYAVDFSTSGQADVLGPRVMTSTFEAIPEDAADRRLGASAAEETGDLVQDDISHKIIFDESIEAGPNINAIVAYELDDDGSIILDDDGSSWSISACAALGLAV